jgi:hypothetical protein
MPKIRYNPRRKIRLKVKFRYPNHLSLPTHLELGYEANGFSECYSLLSQIRSDLDSFASRISHYEEHLRTKHPPGEECPDGCYEPPQESA